MSKCEDEKVIVEKDRMGLVQALGILHNLRDLSTNEYILEAFQVVFEWIDNAVVLFMEFGRHSHDEKDGGTT